jgi:membrane protein YdbS with pleckstrin-like domain
MKWPVAVMKLFFDFTNQPYFPFLAFLIECIFKITKLLLMPVKYKFTVYLVLVKITGGLI